MEKEKILKKQKHYNRVSNALVVAEFAGMGILVLSFIGFLSTVMAKAAWGENYINSVSEQYSAYKLTQKEEAKNKLDNYEITNEEYDDYVASFNFEGFLKDTYPEKLADYQSTQNAYDTAIKSLGFIGIASAVEVIASVSSASAFYNKEKTYTEFAEEGVYDSSNTID